MSDTSEQNGYADDLECTMDEVLEPVSLLVAQVILLEDESPYAQAMAEVVRELAGERDFPLTHLSFSGTTSVLRDQITELCGHRTLVVCGESEYCNPTTKEGFKLIDQLNRQGFVDLLLFQISPPEVAQVFEDIRVKGVWRLLRSSADQMFDRNISDFRSALEQTCRFVTI